MAVTRPPAGGMAGAVTTTAAVKSAVRTFQPATTVSACVAVSVPSAQRLNTACRFVASAVRVTRTPTS